MTNRNRTQEEAEEGLVVLVSDLTLRVLGDFTVTGLVNDVATHKPVTKFHNVFSEGASLIREHMRELVSEKKEKMRTEGDRKKRKKEEKKEKKKKKRKKTIRKERKRKQLTRPRSSLRLELRGIIGTPPFEVIPWKGEK